LSIFIIMSLTRHKKVISELKSFLNEEVVDILKEFNKDIISEASKKDVLIKKLGLSEINADRLDRLCGSFAVWMANKLIAYQEAVLKSWNDSPLKDGKEITKQDLIDKINNGNLIPMKSQSITSIMDYIRVGLNGDNSSIKNSSFQDLVTAALEWHESLDVGQGEINYVEVNKVIADFRDEEGMGFYWVDLQTNDSNEECTRMGHCGRTYQTNSIYSLRENMRIPGTKYTLNKSHLTAAISNTGVLFQLKGPKNSKPQEKFNKYVLPLFYVKKDDGYLIEGFGREYQSANDFKLSDLSEDEIRKLYQDRPNLFDSREYQKLLKQMGIIETPERDYKFLLKINPWDVNDYVQGDWTVRKTKTGRGSIGLFETILSGDMWDLWDNYDADWTVALQYYVNKENERRIRNMLVDMAEKAGVEFDTELNTEDAIEEYDTDGEIQRALSSAMNDAESGSYQNYMYKTLKSELEEYGNVIKFNDEGVEIEIDLTPYIDNTNEEYVDAYFEDCNDDISCVFTEMLHQGDIDKPKFSIDDRWYPDVDNDEYNSLLNDRLSEI
jgi:hypothetical protein